MSCEHPESALVEIEPEFTWCSRCGALAQLNEVYEKTWRLPSFSGAAEMVIERLRTELKISQEVRLAQAAHINRLLDEAGLK